MLVSVAYVLALVAGALIYWEIARSRRLRKRIEHVERTRAELAGHLEVVEQFGSEPFVMFDERGLIRNLNGRAQKLFGFASNELYGRSILSLIPNLDRTPRREPGRIEVRRKDGVRLWLQYRAARTQRERNMYLFFSDPPATAPTPEPQLAAVERVVGRILGHLEEPLTTINGYSGLALASAVEDSAVRAELEKIAAASERASRVAEVLLSFTGKQPASAHPVDLNAAVLAMKPAIRAAVNAEVAIRTASEPALATVNEDGLREAILILCESAERRLRSYPRRIEISVEASGANRVLRIADNGEPLSEGALAHLFEPLYLNREELGVELSPVYGLVHRWGGEIRVSSGGEGTIFEFLLH
ncbi:MAG TPA: ATP-binding protein [Bryobacteraceae bacterium]|nr:ATP-binding protein [Bryobacteraceae bacterium]